MFLKLLKVRLMADSQVENLRVILNSHCGFSSVEAFRYFDPENTGKINADQLLNGFHEGGCDPLELKAETFNRAVELLDSNEDGVLDYNEFSAGVAARNRIDCASTGFRSVLEKDLAQQSWLNSLLHLLVTLVDADASLNARKEEWMINAGSIFEEMDEYRMGYVSNAVFGRWVKNNCGFCLGQAELAAVQEWFDPTNDYRFGRDSFCAAVGVAEFEDEDANG